MKIKHCPFCGENRVESKEIIIHGNGNKLPCVKCMNCGALVTAPKKHPEDALKRWNSRVLDVSRDELMTLERLLKHDIFTRMREYVEDYAKYQNVCAHNDIKPFYLKPMSDACDLMAKMEKLLFAIMEEKEDEK